MALLRLLSSHAAEAAALSPPPSSRTVQQGQAVQPGAVQPAGAAGWSQADLRAGGLSI